MGPATGLQNLCNIAHLTLGVLLHYLGKLKFQIFCRYSADIEDAPILISLYI